jgi:hypothetical protein
VKLGMIHYWVYRKSPFHPSLLVAYFFKSIQWVLYLILTYILWPDVFWTLLQPSESLPKESDWTWSPLEPDPLDKPMTSAIDGLRLEYDHGSRCCKLQPYSSCLVYSHLWMGIAGRYVGEIPWNPIFSLTPKVFWLKSKVSVTLLSPKTPNCKSPICPKLNHYLVAHPT